MLRELWENCSRVAVDAVKCFKPTSLILQSGWWKKTCHFSQWETSLFSCDF